MGVAASGLAAQNARLRVIAQNIANSQSTGSSPTEDPYRRQMLTFQNVLDRQMGVEVVKVGKYEVDRSEFPMRYMPQHPAADANGMVRFPNVNPLIESADLKEAQRSYEANLSVVETTRSMMTRTLDLMRQ